MQVLLSMRKRQMQHQLSLVAIGMFRGKQKELHGGIFCVMLDSMFSTLKNPDCDGGFEQFAEVKK